MLIRILGWLSLITVCCVNAVFSQVLQDTTGGIQTQPFVKGGAFDKPYLYKMASGRAAVGGYAETHFRYERDSGVMEELTFVPKRFNLFLHALISDRFRMAAELEFEEGTEEILLELAAFDFEIHHALIFRGGMLLTPLGKFNLAHDSPANLMTDRPLVSTEIIPTALSEPGMGFYGSLFPTPRSRVTYEVYAMNGLHAGLIEDSAEGTRIAMGKHNIEDNNNRPAFAGRIGLSPLPQGEVGFSWHTGGYNVTEVEGLTVDESRRVTILAADWEYRADRFLFLGEYARAAIDIPPGLRGSIYAERQQGAYFQGSADFLRGAFPVLPNSNFTGVMRLDLVDFDRDQQGDAHTRWTLGLNFRPAPDAVFKLDYFYGWRRDRFDVKTNNAGILFSVASYF